MRGPAAKPGEHIRPARRLRLFALFVVSATSFLIGDPVHAQAAANATLSSNEVYRGRSLSADDPALTIALGIDDSSGFYAGGSVSVSAGEQDLRVSSFSQYAGYAWRGDRTSFEIGVIHRHHSDSLDPEYSKDFFEAYVGATRGKTSARLYVSPDYIPGDRLSAYASLNTELVRMDDWSLAGHAGLALKPSAGTGSHKYHSEVDWSLSVGRPFGEFNVSIGVADSTDSDPAPFDGPLAFISISRAF